MSRVAKVISTLFLLVFGLGLTACGSTSPTAETNADKTASQINEMARYYVAFNKTLPDGRVVPCVAWVYAGSGGAVDCDFIKH